MDLVVGLLLRVAQLVDQEGVDRTLTSATVSDVYPLFMIDAEARVVVFMPWALPRSPASPVGEPLESGETLAQELNDVQHLGAWRRQESHPMTPPPVASHLSVSSLGTGRYCIASDGLSISASELPLKSKSGTITCGLNVIR